MSEKSEKTVRRTYSLEFKRTAVDRMVAGESPSKLAAELGIRRKFLYAWQTKIGNVGHPKFGPGLVHHSDRGTQYASNEYLQRLERAEMVISMSGPARPWENAYCESFMETLKREQVECSCYATLPDLQTQMEDFIDRFYNPQRLHSALAYCSPDEFEKRQGAAPLAGMSFPRHEEIYPDA